MNIIDIVIIILILAGGAMGFTRGFFKQTTIVMGFVLSLLLAVAFRGIVANFLCEYFPFFNFIGIFQGVTALNILLYEVIAFIFLFGLLQIVLNLVVGLTSVLENVLNFTIVLGFISKIFGALIGLIEGYIYVFIILFLINIPSFNFTIIRESKLNDKILHNSIGLSNVFNSIITSFDDIFSLVDDAKKENDPVELNMKVLDVLLKNKVTTPELATKLVGKGKIDGPNVMEVIDKYR